MYKVECVQWNTALPFGAANKYPVYQSDDQESAYSQYEELKKSSSTTSRDGATIVNYYTLLCEDYMVFNSYKQAVQNAPHVENIVELSL